MTRADDALASRIPHQPEPEDVCLTTQGIRDVRYDALLSFVVLAEERNFTRAAERLRITQSGLSRRVTQLERQLGTSLAARGAREVVLTADGLAFLALARRVLEDTAAARALMASTGAGTPLGHQPG